VRPRRPSRAQVQREIQLLVRTFPVEHVEVYRVTPGTTGPLGQKTPPVEVLVYKGEALVQPAGGSLIVENLGQIEFDQPYMVVPSHRAIMQGDRMRYKGRILQVEHPPDYWKAFLVVRFAQNQQGT
jgi:hypothetical protein